jgi:lysophospholipase L1-like esterase
VTPPQGDVASHRPFVHTAETETQSHPMPGSPQYGSLVSSSDWNAAIPSTLMAALPQLHPQRLPTCTTAQSVALVQLVSKPARLMVVSSPQAASAKRASPASARVVVIGPGYRRVTPAGTTAYPPSMRPRSLAALALALVPVAALHHVNRRASEVIACRPDVVVVLVGTNDVLATLSPRHEASYRRLKRLPVTPTREGYREGITSSLVRETGARVALCSLPVLGEDLESRTNRAVASYCEVIREVAAAEGAAYLPVHEAMVDALRALGGAGRAYGGETWPMMAAAVRRYALGFDFDEIAAKNGYRLLTDGIHLSSRGARLVVDEVERFVRAT